MRSRLSIPSSFESCLYCTILSKSHSRSPPPHHSIVIGTKGKRSWFSLHQTLFFFPPQFFSRRLPTSPPRFGGNLPSVSTFICPPFERWAVQQRADGQSIGGLLPPPPLYHSVSVLRWHRALRTCISSSLAVVSPSPPPTTSCHCTLNIFLPSLLSSLRTTLAVFRPPLGIH
jgi:hypothetical protein